MYTTSVILSHSRTKQLLQNTRVLKQPPVWLDVVEAFPPEVVPKHNRTPKGGRVHVLVYPDDPLRSQFYEDYTVEDSHISLFEGKEDSPSTCDRYSVAQEREIEDKLCQKQCCAGLPLFLFSCITRFVSEQMDRLNREDVATAAQAAFEKLRSEGVKLRARKGVKPDVASNETPKKQSVLRDLQTLLQQLRD